ncbi:MAG TPA: response regulator transcription factor [Sphingomonas sp.]|nr:response regulator transcription factor [Sphingomonas sp.]
MRALVVEDASEVAEDLRLALEATGFIVDLSPDGTDAWFQGDVEDYDIAILDLGLPQLDGLSVLRRWRAAGRLFPVIIVSARGNWIERVEGIDAGADDYLGKPFEMGELIARVRGVLRRAAGRGSNVVTVGRLRVDTQRATVDLGGVPVRLSPLEFRLLDYLIHQGDRAVPAHEIADHLYGAADSGDSNAIEALVARLRRKVGADVIVTRRGFGYQIDGAP